MLSAILIILALPFVDLGRSRGLEFRPLIKIALFVFVANFLILMQLVGGSLANTYKIL